MANEVDLFPREDVKEWEPDYPSGYVCAYCPNELCWCGAEGAVGICARCWEPCPVEWCYGERRHKGKHGANASVRAMPRKIAPDLDTD